MKLANSEIPAPKQKLSSQEASQWLFWLSTLWANPSSNKTPAKVLMQGLLANKISQMSRDEASLND